MKKTLFFALAIVCAIVLSCSKQEVTGQPASDAEECGLVVKVSMPQTKLNYEDTSTGLVPTFKEGDRLIAYFRNSGGSMIGNAVPMSIDAATISTDKKTATFKSSTSVTIPSTAVSIFFYLDNETNGVFALSGASINNLKNQDGTLADVSKHQVIVGNALVSDLTDNGDGKKVANVTFVYKTSVLKLALTFPAGIVPTADDNTTITITDPDVYNSVRVAWGEPHSTASNNSKGAITVHPCSVSGQVATAYVTVWEKSVFDGATIVANVSGDACSVDFDAAGATVAGKVHNVVRTLVVSALFDLWKNDAAGSYTIDPGLTVSASNGLAYNSGTGAVTWDANTSEIPVKKSISFTNGKSAFITQLEAKDFVGNWGITCKRYAPNTNLGVTANTTAVTQTLSVSLNSGQTFTEGTRDITNNLNIAGFINTYIAEACADIVYDTKSLRFGIFLNGANAQAVNTGKTGYNYVTLLPEMGNGWTAYNFCPVPFNNFTNKGWLWFVPDDADDPTGNFHYSQSDWGTYDANGTKKNVLGLVFAKCKSATPSAADYEAPNGTGSGTSYEVIYQMNPNSVNNATLVRK